MSNFKWTMAILLTLWILAVSSTSRADDKDKHQGYPQSWYDQDERGDEPPGWDQGKKKGWRGKDLPPGQAKKYHRSYRGRYHKGYDPYYDKRPYKPLPEFTPVPVPVPSR